MGEARRIETKFLVVNSLFSLSLALFGATTAIFLRKQGFSFLQINSFMLVFWLANFLTELPAGVVADTYGRKTALLIAALIRASGLVLLYFARTTSLLAASAILTAVGCKRQHWLAGNRQHSVAGTAERLRLK